MKLSALAGAALLVAGGALAEDGQAVFAQNCAMCHQTGAVGLPGQFPRLAGRVGPISSKPEGKSYLIDVLSTGLSGQVTIDGQPIIGVMPPFPTLSDDKVAAVLNYLRSLGQAGGADVTAAEVAQLRAAPRKSPGDMMRERKALVQAKIIP